MIIKLLCIVMTCGILGILTASYFGYVKQDRETSYKITHNTINIVAGASSIILICGAIYLVYSFISNASSLKAVLDVVATVIFILSVVVAMILNWYCKKNNTVKDRFVIWISRVIAIFSGAFLLFSSL